METYVLFYCTLTINTFMKTFKQYYKSFIAESIFKSLTPEEAEIRERIPFQGYLKDLYDEIVQLEFVKKVGTNRALKEMLRLNIVPSDRVQIYSCHLNKFYLKELLINKIIPSEQVLKVAVRTMKSDDFIWTMLHQGMSIPDYAENELKDEVNFNSEYQWFMETAVKNRDLIVLKTLKKMKDDGNLHVPAAIDVVYDSVMQYGRWKKN